MARIRSIKPEISESETLAELPLAVCFTFATLWPHCDDRGRRKAQPRLVLADLYPMRDDVTVDDMTEHLILMSEHDLICLYIGCDGKPYLHVVNWDEHQKVDKPSKSRVPPCREHEPDAECSKGHDTCASSALNLGTPPADSATPPETPANPLDTPADGSRTVDLVPRTVDRGPRIVPTTSGALALADQPDMPEANLAKVVAAYVEGATNAGLPRPTERLRGKVGKDAKRLATKDHVPISALIVAARSMGSRGWDDLDRELQRVGANATVSKPSTSDQRSGDGLALAEQLRAEGR